MDVDKHSRKEKSTRIGEYVEFEWDNKKAAINKRKHNVNKRKHNVTFQEAATVFGDPLAITFNDPDHSIDEQRLLTFGTTRTGKLIIISHTERHGKMRIISARRMTKQERKIYEEG